MHEELIESENEFAAGGGRGERRADEIVMDILRLLRATSPVHSFV